MYYYKIKKTTIFDLEKFIINFYLIFVIIIGLIIFYIFFVIIIYFWFNINQIILKKFIIIFLTNYFILIY